MYKVKLLERNTDHELVRALDFKQAVTVNYANQIDCILGFFSLWTILWQADSTNSPKFQAWYTGKRQRRLPQVQKGWNESRLEASQACAQWCFRAHFAFFVRFKLKRRTLAKEPHKNWHCAQPFEVSGPDWVHPPWTWRKWQCLCKVYRAWNSSEYALMSCRSSVRKL